MVSRIELNATTWAAAVLGLLFFSFTGCQHPKTPPSTKSGPTAKAEAKPEGKAESKPKPGAEAEASIKSATYSEKYDLEIKEIMALASKGEWEAAQIKATALHAKATNSPMVERVYTWVVQTGKQRREQALENEIRSIDAQNSVFDPTIKSMLKEGKDRGLPARKDIRDTVNQIENSKWIPDSYGKTVREQGPLFEFESTKSHMIKVLDKEVTIHLDNVPLETVIQNLSQTAGINIVADKSLPALKQLMTVNMEKVNLGEFLRYAERYYDLQFQVGNDIVWVVDGKDPKKLMEETRFYRLRKGFVLPAEFGSPDATKTTTANGPVVTTVEVQKFNKFVNDEAPANPSLERAITNLFTGSKWMIDYEHNLVVARGTAQQLDVLEKIIREFDRPIQQVLIEARFVTISKPAFMQLGVLWETGRIFPTNNVQRTPTDFTGLTPTTYPAMGIGIQYLFTNVFGVGDLTATISALEQTGESQTLSAPRLTVLNNRPARISDGKVQYYYEEYQVAQTVQQYYSASTIVPAGKPSKITAGAELDVMASVSGDGNSILLALNPRVNTEVQLEPYTTIVSFNQAGNVSANIPINLPTYRTEELATRMVVKSGETVVMGGVLEQQRSTVVESVPVLGDLPLIGTFFRRRTDQDTPRYLLVFVTATIVKDTGEFLVYDDEHHGTNSVPNIK